MEVFQGTPWRWKVEPTTFKGEQGSLYYTGVIAA